MKTSLLTSVLLFFMSLTYGQSIQITEMTATATTDGINVNLKTVSFNGAEYIGFDYTIEGTTVNVSACYSFNFTLPVLTFENDLFIPVTNPGNYTVNVTVYNSSSPDVCDYFSSGGSATTSVLSTPEIADNTDVKLFPNPTNGWIELSSGVTIDAISIYDITGKIVISITENLRKINLSGLSNGIYFIEMRRGSQSAIQRIVKQ